MFPIVPIVNAGKRWLQYLLCIGVSKNCYTRNSRCQHGTYLVLVSANGKIMLAMKTSVKPARIVHFGSTYLMKLEENTATIAEKTPVGRKWTAVTTVPQ
jgi:hypothetical protein